MKVRILGTRGHIEPTAPGHALHSGVLVDDVLFDLGEREYVELRPAAAFVTHLHEDHAFFVNDEEAAIPFPVYAPQDLPGRKLKVIRSTVEVNGMRITPIPTVHSAGLRSCAYLIEKDLSRLLYTGDLIAFRDRYQERIPELDMVIADGSFIRRGGLVRRDPRTGRPHGHTGIPDLVELFTPLARRLVFAHFGSWFYHDIPSAADHIRSLSTSREIIVAEDGMELEAGPD